MALDTDSNCWHCGEPLPGRENAGRKKIKARDSWLREAGPGSVAVYAGLTLLVVAAALMLTRTLGSQPQLQVRLGTRTSQGWTFFTAEDRRFTVTLPDSWTWLDGTDPAVAESLRSKVEESPHFQLATHPLGAETSDLTILFVAEGRQTSDGEGPFMTIGTSPLLNRLTYQETVSFLMNSDYDVQEVRFVDDFDKSHVSIIINTPLTGEAGRTIRCRQQFVLGREESLLASLCAPEDNYPAHSSQFDEIMATFQYLET